METLKIKCPGDGLILTIRNIPGIENKFVTCPKCGRTRKVSDYINLSGIPFGNKNEECLTVDDQTLSDDKSQYNDTPYNPIIGKIVVMSTSQVFQLKLGRNVIGRCSTQSSADFQINCPNKRMSRCHLVIDVVKEAVKGIVHYVTLYKEAVNATFIGQMKLEYGDKIPLSDGTVIKLPDVDIKFVIPDEEATVTDDDNNAT